MTAVLFECVKCNLSNHSILSMYSCMVPSPPAPVTISPSGSHRHSATSSWACYHLLGQCLDWSGTTLFLCVSQSCSLSLVLNLPLLLQYLLYSEHVLILILFPTVQNREQFVVPEVVPWSKVGDALGYYFLAHTGRGLTHQNLDYLGGKLLCVGGCG